MALFCNFGVNRQNRLCGAAYTSTSPRNAADFLELAENCTFLDQKRISAHWKRLFMIGNQLASQRNS
jgi:hypothetical protein